jgi:hypothetical protein
MRSLRSPTWPLVGLACALGAAPFGCAPLSPTPPFHVGETSEIMPRGRVAVAPAVGFGSIETIGGGVGAAARVRLGLGGGHEVRAEGAAIGRINEDEPTPERPWLGKSTATLGKLSWKLGLTDWLAVSAGAGGSHSATGNAIGGDLAVLAATPSAYLGGRVRPYAGVRAAIARPVGRDRDEAGGVTKALFGALGLAYDWSLRTQLFVELGAIGEWNRGYFSTEADPDRMIQSQHHPGGYLALGATFYFGGRHYTAPPAGAAGATPGH